MGIKKQSDFLTALNTPKTYLGGTDGNRTRVDGFADHCYLPRRGSTPPFVFRINLKTTLHPLKREFSNSRVRQLLYPINSLGGTDGNRTRVDGFADRCLTTRPPRHMVSLVRRRGLGRACAQGHQLHLLYLQKCGGSSPIRQHPNFLWCGEEDLNLHRITPTTTSR